jgi:hypothetical protein
MSEHKLCNPINSEMVDSLCRYGQNWYNFFQEVIPIAHKNNLFELEESIQEGVDFGREENFIMEIIDKVDPDVNLEQSYLRANFGTSQYWSDSTALYLLEQLKEFFDDSEENGSVFAMFATSAAYIAYTESYEKSIHQILWLCYCVANYDLGIENDPDEDRKLDDSTRGVLKKIGDILHFELFSPAINKSEEE